MHKNIILFLALFLFLSFSCIYAETQTIDKKDFEEYSKKLLPDAKEFKKEEFKSCEYYIGYGKDKEIIGYIVQTATQGHSDLIKLFVGVDSKCKVVDLVITYQAETPEYYKNVEQSKDFLEQFKGKQKQDITIKTPKNENGKINLATGASLSSTAIIKGVKKALEFVENLTKPAKDKNEKQKQ